jgi:hypothetical protein
MVKFPSQLLISTKHQKHQILQPLFGPFGTTLITDSNFDTDAFGTFCGGIPRLEGPKITVKEKCLAGMKFSNTLQGLASEGSFGLHPAYPFLTVNEEWVVYIDLLNQIEVYGHSLSLDLCFERLNNRNAAQLDHFLNRIDFGKQGLILKDQSTGLVIQKGISCKSELFRLLKAHPDWVLETELRSHFNPKRQINIRRAAQNLIDRMHSFCPNCQAIGYWVEGQEGNLPCSTCQNQTNSYQYLKFHCFECRHEELVRRKDKLVEDPQYCPICNP